MTPLALVAGVAVLLALGVVWRGHRRRQALNRLRAGWDVLRAERPKTPETDLARVALYHQRLTEAGAPDGLDDQTWVDLGLDEVFLRVDHARCGVGQQALYHRLRCPAQTQPPLDRLETMAGALGQEPDVRERVQLALDRLDVRGAFYLPNLFLRPPPSLPWPYRLAPVLSIAAVALIAAAFVWPPLALGALLVGGVNLFVHESARHRIMPYVLPLQAASPLVAVGARLARELRETCPALAEELAATSAPLRAFGRHAAALQFEGRGDDLGSVLAGYVNMVLLAQVNVFLLCSRSLREQRDTIRRLYDAVGDVDVALSVIAYRRGLARWCLPEREASGIDCTEAVHPLLDDPVPNSLRLAAGGVLVTGTNMAGKTTFMRAVALNAVLGQSLHTCTAERYRAPFLRVRSLIDRRDDLLAGQSYFYAEVLGVRALLDHAAGPHPALFVVDEPFKGTNAAERLAASKAVLDALAAPPHFVLASTHDTDLAGLLEADWDLLHFREEIDDGEFRFDYRARPGLSSTRNALRLLQAAGLPEAIVADARRISEALSEAGDPPA